MSAAWQAYASWAAAAAKRCADGAAAQAAWPQAAWLPAAPRQPPRTFSIASAVFTGTVDFSTMILLLLDTLAMTRAAPSQ